MFDKLKIQWLRYPLFRKAKMFATCRLVSFLIFVMMAPALGWAQSSADIVEKAEACVIKIDVQNVGLGSGYIIDASGIAVTNVHVMAGAQNNKATATFPNGKVYKITGTYFIDEGRDICIIQLDARDLPVLPLSNALPRKGEEVIALGSPVGLSFSATRGIISAVRGEKEMQEELGDPTFRGTWVQVDAPLSPGNSGGPLINIRGELVAMSTRASAGRAQNINFGISVTDIDNSINQVANNKVLTPLSEKIGRVRMEDIHPESGEIVERVPVPEASLQDYIAEGRVAFNDLSKGLRREVTAQNEILAQMKKGKIDLSVGGRVVREINSGRFYFGTQIIKDKVLSRQESRIRELTKIKDSVGRVVTNESVFSLLWNYGPRLDPRKKGSVGFMPDATVLHAATEHDVIIEFEENVYLLWVEDSAGLSLGQNVTPTPVYVVGSETMAVPGRGSIAVTILNSVLENELREAVFGASPATGTAPQTGSSAIRVWKDTTGKYEIKASLIDSDDKQVVLKKEDGSIVTVPLEKLSEDDRKFLKK